MKKTFVFAFALLFATVCVVCPTMAQTTIFSEDFLENDLPAWDHGSVNLWSSDVEWYKSKWDKEGVIDLNGCLGPSNRPHSGDGYTWIEREIELPQSGEITLEFDRRSDEWSGYAEKWYDGRLVIFVIDEKGDRHNIYDKIVGSEWIEETVDLTKFSGQMLKIRFEGHGGGNVKACSSCTGRCEGEGALLSYVKITGEITKGSTSYLISSVSDQIGILKHNNVDTTPIEEALKKAQSAYGIGNYDKAYELALSAQKIADDAYEAQQHVESAQSEIDESGHTSPEVKDVETKTKEAKDAGNIGLIIVIVGLLTVGYLAIRKWKISNKEAQEEESGVLEDEDIMYAAFELLEMVNKQDSLSDDEKIQALKKSSFNFLERIESKPSCGIAHFGLGLLARMLNDWDDAIKEFELALRDDSHGLYPAYSEPALICLNEVRQEKKHCSAKQTIDAKMKYEMFKMAYDKEKKG